MGYHAQFPEEWNKRYKYLEEVNDISYTYPTWAYAMGWFIALGPIILGFTIGFVISCMKDRDHTKV